MTATTERLSTLRHDGLTFDVFDEGPADGEVVVLLHGFPERSSCWREVAPLLHERGYRTVAMDQRGYSPGARPPRRRDYTISTLAGDAAALIDRLGGPVHLVGHDLGAANSWVLAMQRPDLVRTLTAISVPHPAAYLKSVVTSPQFLKSWYILFFQLPLLPELGARRPGAFDRSLRQSGMTREQVDRFRDEIVDAGAIGPALRWYRAFPFADFGILRRRVTVPTTLIWSDADAALTRWCVEKNDAYVDAPYELVVLEGVSHWIPTEAPRACADAILARIGR
jgi:pimeloyl-ACP methyl ester carboxylesterase